MGSTILILLLTCGWVSDLKIHSLKALPLSSWDRMPPYQQPEASPAGRLATWRWCQGCCRYHQKTPVCWCCLFIFQWHTSLVKHELHVLLWERFAECRGSTGFCITAVTTTWWPGNIFNDDNPGVADARECHVPWTVIQNHSVRVKYNIQQL